MTSRSASGRFVLRLSPGLHERLRTLAAERGQSLNALCVALLQRGVGDEATGAEAASGPGAADAQWFHRAERFAQRFGYALVGVVLFGSAARGELRASSDIDLLVVLEAGVSLRRELYQQWDGVIAEQPAEREINAHFVHLPQTVDEAGSLWLEVAVDGHVVGERNQQVSRLLTELRRAIAAGRFVRRMSHGQPYWRRAA